MAAESPGLLKTGKGYFVGERPPSAGIFADAGVGNGNALLVIQKIPRPFSKWTENYNIGQSYITKAEPQLQLRLDISSSIGFHPRRNAPSISDKS